MAGRVPRGRCCVDSRQPMSVSARLRAGPAGIDSPPVAVRGRAPRSFVGFDEKMAGGRRRSEVLRLAPPSL